MDTQLKELIETAERILVTSHISPDPDALCSVLLAGTSLQINYPQKQVLMSMEELTGELNFLAGYDKIAQNPLIESIKDFKPALIIIVDAMNYSRCTRGDTQDIKVLTNQLGTKLAIIDHHEQDGVDENDIYINNQSPACSQDCYEIFVKTQQNLPDGYAQTVMLGILSDTNRFLYDNPRHKATFDVVDELIDAGASIEKIINMGSRYSVADMQVLGELSRNIQATPEYTYTYLSNEFIEDWVKESKKADELKMGSGYFVNEFIRNIDANQWGFMVYRDIAVNEPIYSVSFRAVSGVKDVSQIAKDLGGGGHKSAAGAKISANSIEEAIDKIKAIISAQA